MDPKIISGTKWSSIIRNEIKEQVVNLPFKPKLAGILVGDREDSKIYVRNKQKAFLETGMDCDIFYYDKDVMENELIEKIKCLNQDITVHGILVQLPLPSHLNEQKILCTIDSNKDVDGIAGVEQIGRLACRNYTPTFIPCTARGCLELLKRENVNIEGKHTVVIGRSQIVGMPVALLMLKENSTVTVCHSKTVDIEKIVRTADIMIVAIGIPQFVKADWVKPGSIVIDVGINRVEDKTKNSGYKLVGDVDFDNVYNICDKITPVPGGCGPLTIAMLLLNVYESAVKFMNNK